MTVSVAMRYKEGKKAMKSLIGGMSSFRMATFISVILVPIVSFYETNYGSRIGNYIVVPGLCMCQNRYGILSVNTDKSIAGVMAAVLAFKGSGWALLVGFAMNLLLSNMDFQKKKLGVLTTEELDQVDAKEMKKRRGFLHRKNRDKKYVSVLCCVAG